MKALRFVVSKSLHAATEVTEVKIIWVIFLAKSSNEYRLLTTALKVFL